MLFSTLYLFEFGTFIRNPNPPPSKGNGDMKEPNVLCQGLTPYAPARIIASTYLSLMWANLQP